MIVHILVEGEIDQRIIEQLLTDLRKTHSFKIMKCGGRDAARPMARKLLLQYSEPVALLLDADTTDTNRAHQQQRDLEDYLRWAPREIPFIVQQFVPEIEVIFFERPKAVMHVLGRNLREKTILIGKKAPKEMLKDLLEEKHIGGIEGMLSKFNDADLGDLREHPMAKGLRDFIEQHGAKEGRRRATG